MRDSTRTALMDKADCDGTTELTSPITPETVHGSAPHARECALKAELNGNPNSESHRLLANAEPQREVKCKENLCLFMML